jgi:HD-GYP domain-containing protein (c-di-GMP phosphodiesterase class II)/DNA-binding CsgD family transcriptional regulator
MAVMSSQLRLADLLAGLSIVADLGYGLPLETAMRAGLVGTDLARRLGLSEPEAAEVFYVSLLLHVGCLAYSHETAALLGDDAALHRAVVRTKNSREIVTVLVPGATQGLPPVARLKSVALLATRGKALAKRHDLAACEAARAVARRIGLPEAVSTSLYDVHEWWNGRGARGLKGDAIAPAARIARVASEAVFLSALGDAETVTKTLRHLAGKNLDPNVVATFTAEAINLLADAESGDPRRLILEAEPAPVIEVDEADLPVVAAAFGDMADVKTPFTHGHSSEVAQLSVAAATRLGLDRQTVARLEVGALLHDVGYCGVSNAVWEKPGPLTTAEAEQVRLHAYYSERILTASEALAPVAPIVGMHHERLDGSGYHRQATAPAIPTAARGLAAADAWHALTHARPHRPARAPEPAADELRAETGAGRLDGDAVAAVLAVAGHDGAVGRPRRPAGLTERQVEVLRLVAQGLSNPQIAERLVVSRRTAEHHVQDVYAKIGVSSRAAAALFAMEHDLLRDG